MTKKGNDPMVSYRILDLYSPCVGGPARQRKSPMVTHVLRLVERVDGYRKPRFRRPQLRIPTLRYYRAVPLEGFFSKQICVDPPQADFLLAY